MSKGSYFNNAGRRSGGYRRDLIGIPPGAMERAMLIETLRVRVRNAGLTGIRLQEVYARLDATDTDVLRECVKNP